MSRRRVGGVEAFDDSKGTNVGATVAALVGLGADKAPGKLVVILGGDGKGQDFAPLAEPVARHARAVALIGRDAPAIERRWPAPACRCSATALGGDALVLRARAPGDAVLLSPACASLDMFRNYGTAPRCSCRGAVRSRPRHGETLHEGAARRLRGLLDALRAAWMRARRRERAGARLGAARPGAPARMSGFDQPLVWVVVALLASAS